MTRAAADRAWAEAAAAAVAASDAAAAFTAADTATPSSSSAATTLAFTTTAAAAAEAARAEALEQARSLPLGKVLLRNPLFSGVALSELAACVAMRSPSADSRRGAVLVQAPPPLEALVQRRRRAADGAASGAASGAAASTAGGGGGLGATVRQSLKRLRPLGTDEARGGGGLSGEGGGSSCDGGGGDDDNDDDGAVCGRFVLRGTNLRVGTTARASHNSALAMAFLRDQVGAPVEHGVHGEASLVCYICTESCCIVVVCFVST